MLKDLAIIASDECQELFDGILDETHGNTGHLLGKEHVLKNIQKKTWTAFIPVQTNEMDC